MSNFLKCVEKIQFLKKSYKINGYVTRDQYTIPIIFRSVLRRMLSVSVKRCREN